MWSEKGKGGKRHSRTGVVDLERTDVGEAHPLPIPADGQLLGVLAREDGFTLVWTHGDSSYSAPLDRSGKPGKVARTRWKRAPSIVAVAHCGATLYAVEGGEDAGLRLMAVDGKAPRELVRFRRFSAPEATQLTCTGDAAVVGRKAFNERTENIAFWVTTVDAEGNRRDRRIKDMKGKPAEIRLPRLSGQGDALTAFWTQGTGARTELYARPIGCR
jgi:hypothetical protein